MVLWQLSFLTSRSLERHTFEKDAMTRYDSTQSLSVAYILLKIKKIHQYDVMRSGTQCRPTSRSTDPDGL